MPVMNVSPGDGRSCLALRPVLSIKHCARASGL
jgi:hypothetical protein